MADKTSIEWTDATWNVITGCSVVSPGCTNCYAMRLAGSRLAYSRPYAGLTQHSKAGPVWNGQVRLNDQVLEQPLRWTRPRRIFVNAMGDLFHENVPDAWIDAVYDVMRRAEGHTFQVLTKRADRMRAYYDRRIRDRMPTRTDNIWLGVSAEDQERLRRRIWQLSRTPARVRWISAEPLLGPLEISRVAAYDHPGFHANFLAGPKGGAVGGIDWVVAGGESGPGARPMHPAWPAALHDECARYSVPFLFKQWGDWKPTAENQGEWPVDAPGHIRLAQDGRRTAEGWPMQRVGKHHAGRLLDGRLHDAYPYAEPAHV